MREKISVWISMVALLLTSTAMIRPSNAPTPTTIYVSPVMNTGNPGDYFTVDIMIAGVSNLYGYEFLLRYDTNVLTATDMQVGNFFPTPPGYSVWHYEITDDLGNGTGYTWLAVTLPKNTVYGVSGSGKLANVTFTVDSIGADYLDLYVVGIGDPQANSLPYIKYDGYFSNVATTFEANLIGKSAWPEHHHFVAIKDEDGNQTLFGKVRNTGTVRTRLLVNFTIYDETGFTVGTPITQTVKLNPGDTTVLSLLWDGYTVPMKYSVEARCYYDGDGDGHPEAAGPKLKPFSFAVV